MHHERIRRYVRHGTLPQLRVFDAVARLKSFTRAGEELHMAQPTVSVQIKKLTETVGLPLLEQVGKRVQLTEAGRILHEACGEIFGVLSRVDQTLQDMRGLKAGTLRVAVSSAGKYLAPHLLSRFVKAHPGIDVALHVGRRDELLERLARNADDLYMLLDPPGNGDFVVERVLRNPLYVYAGTQHPLARETDIEFRRLAHEPFVMREPGSSTRMAAERAFEANGVAPRVVMELGSDEAITVALRTGIGIAILAQHSLGMDSEPEGLARLDVAGFPVELHWHFVYPRERQLTRAAHAFLKFAPQHAYEFAQRRSRLEHRVLDAGAAAVP